jgi:DNA-binding SARP family transcriptional activator
VVRLEETRLTVLERRIEADLRLGRHRELIGELKSLVAILPLHEWFYSRLMLSLYVSGRRCEALQVYQSLRLSLREELGLDPSPELQHLQRALLTGGISGYLRGTRPVGEEARVT